MTMESNIDLASERVGGKALAASDEFFAPKENLLKAGRAVFVPDKYTDQGKWMDGWETRRKRVPGHDWCVIRLGLPGVIRGVEIDTDHFLGNHPPFASLNASSSEADAPQDGDWSEILPKSPLQPGSQNRFSIASDRRWTHVRLNIYPDGGVARFRVYGDVVPNWSAISAGAVIDLAGVQNGGRVLFCNDMFFGPKENLILPGRAAGMFDGWETKRRRTPGNDWVVLKLGAAGILEKVIVDTLHFKGNYPDSCSLEACVSDTDAEADLNGPRCQWHEVLPKTKLKGDSENIFEREVKKTTGPVTHVRLSIYPDGGVSRLRLFGQRGKP